MVYKHKYMNCTASY